MIVVSVKEAAFLFAVNRIVGRVKVHDDFFRGHGMRRDELLNEQGVDGCGGIAMNLVLQTAKRRGAGQFGICTDRDLHHNVGSQLCVVVKILLAAGNREDPLCKHLADGMRYARLPPGVGNAEGYGPDQAKLEVSLFKQHRSTE